MNVLLSMRNRYFVAFDQFTCCIFNYFVMTILIIFFSTWNSHFRFPPSLDVTGLLQCYL